MLPAHALVRVLSLVLVQPPAGAAAPGSEEVLDWRAREAHLLADHLQLTFPDRFLRAGEAYFDHAEPPTWIVFQAEEVPPPGQAPTRQFAMYVARLRYDDSIPPRINGIEDPVRLSAPGSANTCGWFHPTDPMTLMFGTTTRPPSDQESPGYSRDRSRYQWQFPPEMKIVTTRAREGTAQTITGLPYRERDWRHGFADPSPLFDLPNGAGYAAECSWSPDARHVLYTYRDPKTSNPDLWVWDSARGAHTPLVTARGYNGGGFFSPCGRYITYRSDRRGDNLLQLFVGVLAFDDPKDPGRITGLRHEFQLTDNQQVNWAPYFHPSGRYLVYATSEQGHSNYEIFAIELPDAERLGQGPGADWTRHRERLRKTRLTYASGFDGLPAFSARGAWMIWTSQRGPRADREQRPSSQVWVARYLPGGRAALPEPPAPRP